MADTSAWPAYQTDKYLWGLRFIQILFALIIVGIAGSNISDWHSLGCNSPPQLSFNFATGFLSFLLIIYFILSTGPYIKLRWWHFFAQVALDAVFVIFWIAAAAVADYDCNSVCSACSVPGANADIYNYGFWVDINNAFCVCVFPWDYNYDSLTSRSNAPSNIFRRAGGGGRPRGSSSSSGSNSNTARLSKTLEKGISTATKKGLDATMILLFITSLATVLYLRYSSRRPAEAEAAAEHSAGVLTEHVDNAFKMEQPGANINVYQGV